MKFSNFSKLKSCKVVAAIGRILSKYQIIEIEINTVPMSLENQMMKKKWWNLAHLLLDYGKKDYGGG